MLSTISQNKIAALEELAYNTSILYAKELPGEDYHPLYKKDKKKFRKLIRTSMRMEKLLKDYFKELSESIDEKIDWSFYYNKVNKGAVFQENIDFESERIELEAAFEDTLDDIFGVGIEDAISDLGVQTDFTPEDAEAIKFLKSYTLQLAADITNTTKDRVKQSILRSIELGESQEEATARLGKIIDNPKRAAMIAHTETVRAYSEGKLEAGKRMGAQFKVWRDGQPRACPACSKLHGIAVPIDKEFPLLTGGSAKSAPAHPWCKCLTKLVLSKEFLRQDEILIENPDNVQGALGKKGKKSGGGSSLVWITTKTGKHIPIGAKSGFGFNVARVEGLGYRRANKLVSYEGAPDKGRVNAYKILIKRGHSIAPLFIKKSNSGLWGIEDGKHRYAAFTALGHKFVPTITRRTKSYDAAVARDNRAIERLIKENS